MEAHYEALHGLDHISSTRDESIALVEYARPDITGTADSVAPQSSLDTTSIQRDERRDAAAMPPIAFMNRSGHTPSYEGQMTHIWVVHALHFAVFVFNFTMLMLWALDVKLLEIPVQDSGPVSSVISIVLQSTFTLYIGLLFLFTQTIVNDRTIRGETSIVNMHVILQAWRGPSSAFLQLVSAYFPVTQIRTPPDQAWNILLALLYLTSASGVVLTTSSVLGVAVTQKLIVLPEALGGNYLTKDDFDWNQSSYADVNSSSLIWQLASSAMFVSSVNDTLHPGLQGSLLHDTIADNVTSADWATVSAIRLHIDCGALDQSASFKAWGEIHHRDDNDGDSQREADAPVLSTIHSINGKIGNDTGPGPDSIMVSINLPIPPNEWSARWSGNPDAFQVRARYAGSPFGRGPLVNTSNTAEMAWTTQYPPLVFALPTPNYSNPLYSPTSSSVYPGLSQLVLGIIAPDYALDAYKLPNRSHSFSVDLSKSGFPYWMWSKDAQWDGSTTLHLRAALIGCSLRANHTQVNVTRDGLLLSQDLPSYNATDWMVKNTFNWSSRLPTSTIERQFSLAFQSFMASYAATPSDFPLNEYADMVRAIAPEGQLWEQLTSGIPLSEAEDLSFELFEPLLANLTAAYLWSYRKMCLEGYGESIGEDNGYNCGPTANTLHRNNITVYYNGFVGSIKVSHWRAITGFVASLILFLLSIAILGVSPADSKAHGLSAAPYGELKAGRPTEPLGTGLLDVLRLGGPAVLDGALNVSDQPLDQDGNMSGGLADVRVRLVPGEIREVLMLDRTESTPTSPLLHRDRDSQTG